MSKKSFKNITLAIFAALIIAFIFYGYRRETEIIEMRQEKLYLMHIQYLYGKLDDYYSFSKFLCNKNLEDLEAFNRKGDYIYMKYEYTYEMQMADTCKSLDELKCTIYNFRKEHGILEHLESLKYKVDSMMEAVTLPQKYNNYIYFFKKYSHYCNKLNEISLNPIDTDERLNSIKNLKQELDSLKNITHYPIPHGGPDLSFITYGYEYYKCIEDFDKDEERIVSEIYEQNRIDGENYLKENRKRTGVVELKDGLQYKIIKRGSGEKISEGCSSLTLYYEGRFIDGTVFDKLSKKYAFSPNVFINKYSGSIFVPFSSKYKLIDGIYEALNLMSEGDIWEVTVPYKLAFGRWQVGPIKPYSTLIYKLKVESVTPPHSLDS